MDRQGRLVVLAMLTFRREHLLPRVLPLLIEQAARLDPPAEVVVVDNDPGGLARSAVASYPVSYVHEPRPGIAQARNRALDHATGADAIVFIDDDEMPDEHWLDELVGGWRTWRCDAVTGPAVPEYPPGAGEPWALACGMFEPTTRPTGTELLGAATNNLLLDLATVRRLGLRFDESTALAGGEDTLLTHALSSRGGRIVWCQEAAVRDPIPAERLTRRWVLRRTFRGGTTWTRMELALAPSRRRKVLTVLSLVARIFGGGSVSALRVGVGFVRRDLDLRAPAERDLVKRAGLLAGLLGRSFDEYGRAS